jgi:hypothetical protein
MDMSRIRLHIDRLVLTGFEPLEAKALAEALRSQLSEVLADGITRRDWARSHHTPVLHLGRIPLEAGTGGADKFGARMAQAIGKGLKP